MSFISNTGMPAKQFDINNEIKSFVKAKGFDDEGNYKFTPAPNTSRKEGSIVKGSVKGSFTISDRIEDILFEREDFSEKAWKRICTNMGFKYHNHTDIDKFTIHPNGRIVVAISINTPMED